MRSLMYHRVILLAATMAATTATSGAVEPSDLQPGLVATYRDQAPPAGREILRLEPTIALALARGETPHPVLKSGKQMAWRGYVNFSRAGNYRFTVRVQGGTFELKSDGRTVLRGDGPADTTREFQSPEIASNGGVKSIAFTFERASDTGPVVLEVLWQGPGFIREPLAYQFLGHLPQERPDHFNDHVRREHGRFQFEELACAKCHKPAAGDAMAKTLVERSGPDLTDVAKRAYPGWIYAWLANPSSIRPHTTMPRMFPETARGAAERYAITQYLIALSGSPLAVYKYPVLPPNDLRQSMERGRGLYHTTGCAACHNDPLPRKLKDDENEKPPLKPEEFLYGLGTRAGPTAKYHLGQLGSKTRPEALAAYLRDPLKHNPSGRMPQLNLSDAEALDIARYLCRTVDENITPYQLPPPQLRPTELAPTVLGQATEAEQQRVRELPPAEQWRELGSRLVHTKGCLNCHEITEKGQPRTVSTAFPALPAITQAGAKGCLDNQPDPGKTPVYPLDAREREALVAFVTNGLSGAGSAAPAYQARVAFRRFHCLNCHQRDGEGGIPLELAAQMQLFEKANSADEVRPPVLTGIGHKSRTAWLKSVLLQGGRARPWMALRMPQYGSQNVGFLPEALAALEGMTPNDTIHTVERTAAKVAAGRELIGKGGLGCVSCHDIGGFANSGTRGPDLATINQRVRYEWYERWLSQPLRMSPGTRMPQAFIDGQSVQKTILGGDPRQQAEAMWAYLALGPGLPLPEGLEPPKGVVITVKDRAEILRTFLPDAGSRAIAVGYPGGVSVAFNAEECRIAYAWGGNFLDASPVWNNRGGNPARILGQRFWTAPPGHPWGLTANGKIPPDFLARAKHPAFGHPLPDDPPRSYDGPKAVQFQGYRLAPDGRPTFRYRLDEGGRGAVLEVAETPAPLQSPLANGLSRQLEVQLPRDYHTWFLAGRSTAPPRIFTHTGQEQKRDGTTEDVGSPTAGQRVVLYEGVRAVVIEARNWPQGAKWRFVPAQPNGWLALVQIPPPATPGVVRCTVDLWALPKNDDNFLREFLAP
jgi:cbb3-type cytochrome oxidase cytochrome c subunit